MTTVLVYSHDPVIRDQVRVAVGRSPAAGIDDITYLMASTADEVVRAVEEKLVELLVLDGEAAPAGGLGISRELKNSVPYCPPIIVLIGRHDDRWLAKWSQADAVIMQPIDPVALERAAVALLNGEPEETP